MKTTVIATQTMTRPWGRVAANSAAGGVRREHHEAGPGEEGAVTGADEHAVEDEHQPGERLPGGRDQEHRDQGGADLGVGREQGSDERGGGREREPGPARCPTPTAPSGG